ncbi:MAG: MATE family efflux transporter [Clostridiales bacterium]|nr:MATE family efflux transporter [Clostridiales bacterium]
MLAAVRHELEKRFDSRMFTYTQLRGMFIPLLLDQLFIFIIGLLSSALVSSSGEGSMTAANNANVINSLAYAIFSAIALGAGIVIARSKGAGDDRGISRAIAQSCIICTLAGCALGLPICIFGVEIVKFMYPGVDHSIALKSGEYLRYMGLSLLPYSLFSAIFNTFRSMGDTRSSLILTVIINSVHLVCSFVFINVMEMGVQGAGLSFLVARIVGMAFAVGWLVRPAMSPRVRLKDFLSFDHRIFGDILRLGIPLSVEQVLFQGGMLLVQMYIATLPTYQTDAHGIANSIFMLFYSFSYAMTGLAATVCGQTIGAKDIKLTRFYAKNLVWVGRFIMLGAIIVIGPLLPLVLKLFSPMTESLPYIWGAVAIGALPMPLIWCDAFVLTTVTRSAGDSVFATVISLTALLLGRMAIGYVLTIALGIGIWGVWLGQLFEWVFRLLVFRRRFKGAAWIKVNMAEGTV